MIFKLHDGRKVDVFKGGREEGPTFLLHHGTPCEAGFWAIWNELALEEGFQLISVTRPGYGRSDRKKGRRVMDAAKDCEQVLNQLGIDSFVTAGWSGGGPHALACAALMPERCTSAATIAGFAPPLQMEIDVYAGMGLENVSEFSAAKEGESPLRKWMKKNATGYKNISGPDLAKSLGGLIPPVDKDYLNGDFAESLAKTIRLAIATGFDGWIDDDLAFVSDWGFDVKSITVPVAVWQGDKDLMVPFTHGQWLAKNISTAETRLIQNHGHISLLLENQSSIVKNLHKTNPMSRSIESPYQPTLATPSVP
jgi:pimeloyl-ACP methyl ester carboxylesterase